MPSQDPNRKPRENRPTDPFGGPSKRSNTISFSVLLLTIAFFALLQWANGDVGNLLNGPAAEATQSVATVTSPVTLPSESSWLTPTTQATLEDDATAPTTLEPTLSPAGASPAQAQDVQTPRATVQPTPTANSPPVQRASDLPTITYDDLPPEAHATILLIEQGGPFPFSRDGMTFQNRERILPRYAEGYYREYTVITPGASTRGARRIVTGNDGEMYYTSDHYESFSEIVRE